MSPDPRGSLWKVAAMTGLAFEDMLLRQAAASLPAGTALMSLGLGGMIAYPLMAGQQGQRVPRPAILTPIIFGRCAVAARGRRYRLAPVGSAGIAADDLCRVARSGGGESMRVGTGRPDAPAFPKDLTKP